MSHRRLHISNRVKRSCLLTVAAACATWPSWCGAQGIDFGRVLRGVPLPQEARRAQRMGQESLAAAECDRLKQWVSSVPPSPAPTRQPSQLLVYVEDQLFSQHFGKTYDQLLIDDFRRVQQVQATCHRQGLFTPAEQQVVATIWNASMQPRLAQQLIARRGQVEGLAAVRSEVERLQPTETDYRRLDELRSRGESLARSMSADDQRSFQQLIEQTRERVGVPVEQQRVQAAISAASGSDGIAQLAKAHDDLARARLPAQHTEPLRTQLQAEIDRLASAAVASERAAMPGEAASPLESLEASKRWSADFTRRYQSALRLAPSLDELRREVVAARAPVIASVQDRIVSQVDAARSTQEVSEVVSRYLLDEEARGTAGSAIKRRADERIAALQRSAKNEAVFGRQPEETGASASSLSAASSAQAAAHAASSHPAAARCDALAADPNDPTRAAPGVADDAISASAAVYACNDAVRAMPDNARLRFQFGRALLASGRQKEAVAAFQQAAAANHPGAYAYLGTAHQFGAGGLQKSQAKADELHRKAASLGYGSPRAPQASAGVPPGAGGLKGNYEQPAIVKAVYFGDASSLPQERLFTVKYLLTQAEILSGECQSFKLSEIRSYQERIMRSAMPRTQNEAAEQGARNLMEVLVAARNPQAMMDMGAREQRLNDAPTYAASDIVEFTKHHGACGSEALERYTRNLRNYFNSAQASAR